VQTVAHARRLPLDLLQATFGQRPGLSLYRRIRGRGETELQEPSLPSSVSRETTFWQASNDRRFVEAMLFYLTERVGNSLRRKALAGRSVHLKLRYHDFNSFTSSRSLREPTNQDGEIFEVARALLARRWSRTRRLRLVGVGVSGLHRLDRRQSKLFEDRTERHRRVDCCLDQLRDRFGFGVVQRGPSIELTTHLASDRHGYRLRTPALSR
jgi:nucleotidyltransferase/DNA polymerase involved in DNA repair